jgi:hypothetical protein
MTHHRAMVSQYIDQFTHNHGYLQISDTVGITSYQHILQFRLLQVVMANSSTTPPAILFPSQLPTISSTNLAALITANAKWKERSHNTNHDHHLPILAKSAPTTYTTLLLGTSMFERFISVDATQPQPSLHMNSSYIFNAGVGGDTIPAILHRLSQDLLPAFSSQAISTVVINIGSNDFKKKGPLKQLQIYQFCLIMETVYRAFPDARLVVTEIFPKKDVLAENMSASNELLRKATVELGRGIEWLEAPQVDFKTDYDDHVHLNRKGYEIWDAWLAEKLLV